MKPRLVSIFLFVLFSVSFDFFRGGAVEADSSRVTAASENNGTASDVKSSAITPPSTEKGGANDKMEDQDEGLKQPTKERPELTDAKGSTVGKNDKPFAQYLDDTSQKKNDEHQSDVKLEGEVDMPLSGLMPKDSSLESKDKTPAESKQGEKTKAEKADGELDEQRLPKYCDPSQSCFSEKNKFMACLRVPGEDSLDLSLLVQNKGKQHLTVILKAPEFVILEKDTVQLLAAQNEEVKVSVKKATSEMVITLKSGEDQCAFNLRNMIPHSNRKIGKSTFSGYRGLVKKASVLHMLVGASILLGAVLLCIRFRLMQCQESGPRYDKLEVGLTISDGGNKELVEETDGWDENWDDGWNDEEVPMTPTNPVSTPSSKGLASRRSNKDGWKD